ncbi:MAG: hypothetical protein COB97_04290, partial [Paracoccus sp.]
SAASISAVMVSPVRRETRLRGYIHTLRFVVWFLRIIVHRKPRSINRLAGNPCRSFGHTPSTAV